MSAPAPRGERLVEGLPVLAALGLHAVAHERWWLSAPLALVVLGAVLARFSLRRTAVGLLVAGALGAGAGLLLLSVATPPPSPIPAPVLSPLCGALAALATLCVLSGTRLYAWVYACVLVALSLHGPAQPQLLLPLALMASSLLVCIFLAGGLGRSGLVGLMGFGAFALAVAGATWALSRALYAGEGLLMGAAYELLREAGLPTGLGLEPEVGLASRSSVLSSSRALLELRGARPRRLRTVVLERFDGRRWTAAPRAESAPARLPARPAAPLSPGSLEPASLELASLELASLELTFLESLGPYLPAPAGTQAVEGAVVEVLGGQVLRALGEDTPATVRLHAEPGEALRPEPPPGPELVQLPPELAQELRPLAESLTRGASSPRAQAEALEAFFHEKFEYSLQVDLAGEGSPLAVLVRERRPAYCIYFASAMAALLRSRGVAARLVGGFAPEERNPLSGHVVVRERDAHAWVEVYLEEEGRFVPFDPTPWRSREEALGLDQSPGLLRSVTQALGSWLRQGWAAVRRDPAAAAWGLLRSPVVWGALVAFAVWRWRRWRPQALTRGPRIPLQAADARLAAAYRRYLRALRRHAGLVPAPAETDDELLARLRAARGAHAAQPAETFLNDYRRLRYQTHPPTEKLALQEHLENLESVLRSSK